MTLTVNIIGAGKLGKTLGRSLAKTNAYQVLGIYNQHWQSTLDAAKFIAESKAYDHINALPSADVTFITTSDHAIETTALTLSHASNLKEGSTIAHCSGVFDATLLSPLKNKHCHTASLHPMRSFAQPDTTDFREAQCAIEGDGPACTLLTTLFNQLGAEVFPIEAEHKASYHAAGVFGSNFLITLFSLASRSLEKANIPTDKSKTIILNLMQSSIDNLKKTRSVKASLTGPIARGDQVTIKKHLENLEGDAKTLYCALGDTTLSFTSLNEKDKASLSQLFKTG